jgi:hypothetical protein
MVSCVLPILSIGAKQLIGLGAVALLALLVFALFSMMPGLAYGRWIPEGSAQESRASVGPGP